MHIIREKTDCINQKMKCEYLVPSKVWRTFFFYCSPRLVPIRESMAVVLLDSCGRYKIYDYIIILLLAQSVASC